MNDHIFNLFEKSEEKEVKGLKLLLGYFGIFMIFIGLIVMLPILMLIFYPSEANMFYAFLIPGFISIVLGFGLFMLIFRRPKGKLTSLEDILLVVGVWILILLFSSFPFMFYGYTFTQSFFESTSGYTNAGMSIMDWSKEVVVNSEGISDVTSHMLFFHRAMTQLVGGTGLVLIVSSAISERSNLNLYLLEGHNDKLLPNLAKSARLIFSIYLGFIIFGSILYIAVGVSPFDAVCHSMAAVATGGFSTKAGNINGLVAEVSKFGEWRGVLVEVITEILMILGGLNFVIHYSLLRRKFSVLRHFEFTVFFIILFCVYPFMVIGMSQYYQDIGLGFRYATFDLFSSMSTAGFQGVDSYQAHIINGEMVRFPSYLLFVITLVMCVGMQSGSTCGAIKQSRIGLMLLDIKWRLAKSFGKNDSYKVRTIYKFGNKVKVEQAEVTEAETFIALYILLLLLGALIMSVIISICNVTKTLPDGSIETFSFLDCLFEFASCIGDNGLSAGISNNSTLPSLLWIETIGMLLGRLEIFVFITMGGKIYLTFKNKRFISGDLHEKRLKDKIS